MGALRYSVRVLAGLLFIAAIFSIVGGPMAKFLSRVAIFLNSPVHPAPPPIDRPTPQAETALTNLRTLTLLRALLIDPTSCERVRKPALDRCHYQVDGIGITVSWPRHAVDSVRLSLDKRVPRDTAPFAWADLANTLPLLCRGITAEQTEQVIRELPDDLLRAGWRGAEGPLQAETDAVRRVTKQMTTQCTLRFSERVFDSDFRATLEVMPYGRPRISPAAPGPPPHRAS